MSIQENWVDVTEQVVEYPKGKAFDCPCGKEYGVQYGTGVQMCYSCQRKLVDKQAGEREPGSDDGGQTSLGGW